MPKKRLTAEQIVTLLRQIEVSMVQGKSTPVCTENLIYVDEVTEPRKLVG